MKDTTIPGVDFYLAAGDDQQTAVVKAGLDAACAAERRYYALARLFARKHPAANGTGTVVRRTEASGAPRARVAKRAKRTRSTSADDDPPSPEPARFCQCEPGCTARIDHLRAGTKYLDDTHRQRAKRLRDATPELDSHRHDPYLEPTHAELAELKRLARCRCNGRHLPEHDREGTHCVMCGRARSWTSHPDEPHDGLRAASFTGAPRG